MNNNEKEKKSDAELIEEAYKMSYTDWSLIEGLIEQAESEETKEILLSREKYLYHREEASCGCL
ncbi:hypothetical protein EVA_20137 [gut metagenome]|uniref:Uncharacterized protein n=1 Tax=gut metagenome TaxID=749906 RepID=J9FQ91_9ZZZZ